MTRKEERGGEDKTQERKRGEKRGGEDKRSDKKRGERRREEKKVYLTLFLFFAISKVINPNDLNIKLIFLKEGIHLSSGRMAI